MPSSQPPAVPRLWAGCPASQSRPLRLTTRGAGFVPRAQVHHWTPRVLQMIAILKKQAPWSAWLVLQQLVPFELLPCLILGVSPRRLAPSCTSVLCPVRTLCSVRPKCLPEQAAGFCSDSKPWTYSCVRLMCARHAPAFCHHSLASHARISMQPPHLRCPGLQGCGQFTLASAKKTDKSWPAHNHARREGTYKQEREVWGGECFLLAAGPGVVTPGAGRWGLLRLLLLRVGAGCGWGA